VLVGDQAIILCKVEFMAPTYTAAPDNAEIFAQMLASEMKKINTPIIIKHAKKQIMDMLCNAH